jgi:hypothetical protein
MHGSFKRRLSYATSSGADLRQVASIDGILKNKWLGVDHCEAR